MSVEPSTLPASTKENEKTRKRSSGGSEVSDNEETSNSEPDKSLFVPIKKAAGKRKGKDETVHSVLGIMNAVLEKDPAKDLVKFFQEENEKAREHELKNDADVYGFILAPIAIAESAFKSCIWLIHLSLCCYYTDGNKS